MSLSRILAAGYRPYVSTASFLEGSLDLKPFGVEVDVYGTGESADSFHSAYLHANALAFGADIRMPSWVLTDCVLYQTAAVGFTAPKALCPPEYLDELKRREAVAVAAGSRAADIDSLEHIPVTGQVAGLTADRNTWFGFSLISHQFPKGGLKYTFEDGLPREVRLASYTKALALAVYRAKRFMGLTQYDNKAVSHHGLFGRMFLHEPVVWRHERASESFIYTMDVDFEIDTFINRAGYTQKPTITLDADDREAKLDIARQIADGKQFEVVPPFRILSEDGTVKLPILIH